MTRSLLRGRKHTLVMGILNVTPDSFSDGGRYMAANDAVRRGMEMASEGADIIDIGGESTRPGAKEVPLPEELDRTIPVIEKLRRKTDLPLSIDTRKAVVAGCALLAGADIVNDVSGLRFDPDMAAVAARHNAWVIIMHSKGAPESMQKAPRYKDVVRDIIKSLRSSMSAAAKSGIDPERVILDPGIGFGKTVSHNLEILERLDEICAIGRPVCVGLSRKSFIGRIIGREKPEDRLAGSIAGSVIAVSKGARIIRAHDVKETVMAARLTDSILHKNV